MLGCTLLPACFLMEYSCTVREWHPEIRASRREDKQTHGQLVDLLDDVLGLLARVVVCTEVRRSDGEALLLVGAPAEAHALLERDDLVRREAENARPHALVRLGL